MEAPGLLLWGLGRTKGKRGSGDEGGKWGRIQGKPAPVKSFNSEPANIVGKSDFASGILFFGEYFSEFSGVFFQVFSEFVWSIFPNVKYFSGFFNQTEVRTFFFRSH